ncbi:MAG: hypothetical protein ACKOC4_09180 [Planctomycetia bacterium]
MNAPPAEAGTCVTDFRRAFLRWTLDTTVKPPRTVSRPLPMTLNHVRMPVEATATLVHEATGEEVRYALGAECRTEQVWVDRDVWHEPNAGMCLIGGRRHCLVEKHWARANFAATLHPPQLGGQPERHLFDPQEAFADFAMDLPAIAAVELGSVDEIIAALAGDATVVSRTEYRACGHAITLEYPVKTVNHSERERYYQVDTGPVLFPGLTGIGADGEPALLACRLAYVAHNALDWAEFIVCVPTPVAAGIEVHHYSRSVRVEGTRNRMFRVA